MLLFDAMWLCTADDDENSDASFQADIAIPRNMSNTPTRAGLTTRAPMPAFGTFGAHQGSASLLLERSNPDLRRSTPDSEALASSDDEPDHIKTTTTSNTRPGKPGRRTSWLNDVSASNVNRKPSITGPYSPSTSHPGTPGAESYPWTNAPPPPSGSAAWPNPQASYPWTTYWNQDGRKDPPARLQEVAPTNGDPGIPFSIPLEPSFKAHRSLSYSVGQIDNTGAPPSNPISTSVEATRNRLGSQYPGAQRRASRPGGIGGMESGGLGRVREVEDDEEYQRADAMRNAIALGQNQMYQRLVLENQQLRGEIENRDRAPLAIGTTAPAALPGFRTTRLRTAVPEQAENAIDDRDDTSAFGGFGGRDNNIRRMSEQSLIPADRQSLSPSENRAFDGMKKAHWQTSLGFGPIPEAPQSRRHSFADVPTRHGSFSSTGENLQGTRLPSSGIDWSGRDEDVAAYESGSQALSQGDDRKSAPVSTLIQPSERDMEIAYLRVRLCAAEYFNTNESTRRRAEDRVHQHHREPQLYGQHFGVGPYLEPAAQPLFIVNFKCCRSDVFYIQEGTGLHVNVGDLVIVEADRGTDLGTVQHTNVTWEDARRYKDHYAEEHYKWLMMFSLQSRNGGPNVVNPNGNPGSRGSAVGGMGPQGHHGAHDSSGPDLKPKMIKRLAQNHEIQALKDKEGNEAKAKRVCQQKGSRASTQHGDP